MKLISNKEELPHKWKVSIVVPIHKKGDKTDCSYYPGILLLSTSCKMLSNILFSRLISCADIKRSGQVVNIRASFSGGSGFQSRPGDRIS
jgi:hypothetical protein